MDTNNSDESNDEPNSKRPKMETEDSTSSESKDPFLSLPSDILVKIIGYIPVAQWPSLELLDKNFRASTLIAWRQLRNVDLDRDFLIKKAKDQSSHEKFVKSILHKLAEHSPFLTSLSGIAVQLDADVIDLLAQFEHLQSITVDDVGRRRGGITLESVIAFLESTRSRTSLKELRLQLELAEKLQDRATILNRFASSFVSGRELQLPLKLEIFSFMSSHRSYNIRLDTMDTSRLTDLRLGKAWIHPNMLTNLIERAPYLQRIELSFLVCPGSEFGCNGQRLQANQKLLTALASHENLNSIKFGVLGEGDDCYCLGFGIEFIDMLKSIGRRGQLRKLKLESSFAYSDTSDINMDEICPTIHDCMAHLQSIKMNADDEGVCGIASMARLEEIHFMTTGNGRVTPSIIGKIGQLSHLKRLSLGPIADGSKDSLMCLGNVTTLTDLRIQCAREISGDVFKKWADGFGSNLEILMLYGIGEKYKYAEEGLVRLLEKAAGLRVLILGEHITYRSLDAIAKSCPKLEILNVRLRSNDINARHFREFLDWWPDLESVSVLTALDEITIRFLQGIVDHCQKLYRFGGFSEEIRKKLFYPKYRKIGTVGMRFWDYDFDDDEYD